MADLIGHNGGPKLQLEDRWYQTEAVNALFEFYSTPRLLDAKGFPVRKNPLICLPGGTGKSVIIANFFKRAFELHPDTRAIMSTHVKQLIEQNANKLRQAWPGAPLGIYSAGLKSASTVQPIIFGGIQSMVRNASSFTHRDFLVIDEAQLVGDAGSYLKFILALLEANPYLKVIGLSATGYRHGMGCLTNGDIFTDVIYDLCNVEGFKRLIAEGFLVPLIPPTTMPDGSALVQIETGGVSVNGGEFHQGQLSAAMKRQNISFKILQQFVALGADRHSWMFFAQGIEEAEEACRLLNTTFGIPTVIMHSGMSNAENDASLKAWQLGEARCVVNMGMLTTGVDHPALDYIGVGRAMMSVVLWIQILSRGSRPYSWLTERNPVIATAFQYIKQNCLVADFGGNSARLGCINDPKIPRKKGSLGPGDAPSRVCPKDKPTEAFPNGGCGCYNHVTARECLFCGYEFPLISKLDTVASTDQLLADDIPVQQMIAVDRVVYSRHVSKAVKMANPMANEYTLPFTVRVSYYCGLKVYTDWITVEGRGGQVSGRNWFRQAFNYTPDNQTPFVGKDGLPSDVPTTNGEVLKIMAQLRAPSQIRVWMNAAPSPRVMACFY